MLGSYIVQSVEMQAGWKNTRVQVYVAHRYTVLLESWAPKQDAWYPTGFGSLTRLSSFLLTVSKV